MKLLEEAFILFTKGDSSGTILRQNPAADSQANAKRNSVSLFTAFALLYHSPGKMQTTWYHNFSHDHLWFIREKSTWASKEESSALSPRSSENGIKPLSSGLSQCCYTSQTLALVSEIWGYSWSNEEFIRIQKRSVRTRAVLSKIRKLVTMPLSCTLARHSEKNEVFNSHF